MRTIGFRELLKLAKEATFIQGYFNPREMTDYSRQGYQLIFGKRVTFKAGKENHERTEWHTVTIGALPNEPPETFLHASYGCCTAIKFLLLEELKEAQKQKRYPQVKAYPACWGSNGARPATFKVAAGGDVNHDIEGKCYHLEIGTAYLTIAGFECEYAGRYHAPKWGRMEDDDKRDPKYQGYAYTFDPEPSQEEEARE